jgi:hypothetical protein
MNATLGFDKKLVNRDTCMAILFDPDSRPCPRTFDTWKKQKLIPYVKIGHLCFYDPEAVRTALNIHFTINKKRGAV